MSLIYVGYIDSITYDPDVRTLMNLIYNIDLKGFVIQCTSGYIFKEVTSVYSKITGYGNDTIRDFKVVDLVARHPYKYIKVIDKYEKINGDRLRNIYVKSLWK